MPEESFRGVMAHELLHAWRALVCDGQGSQVLEEGSARYVEAAILNGIGTPEARHHLQGLAYEKDPVYGGGYRRVWKLVDDLGWERWRDFMRTARGLPPGY
jgi:hypothetical protein